jgi:hypothetical protein
MSYGYTCSRAGCHREEMLVMVSGVLIFFIEEISNQEIDQKEASRAANHAAVKGDAALDELDLTLLVDPEQELKAASFRDIVDSLEKRRREKSRSYSDTTADK